MSSKDDYNNYLQQLLAAINQAKQPSPIEQAQTTQYNNIMSFLNGKDYRNLPTGVNLPMLSLSDEEKQRQMMLGTDANGQLAAGANPTALDQEQRQLSDDQFQQDYAGQYENAIGGLMGQANDLAGGLQSDYTNRMNTGISGMEDMMQGVLNKPKSFWGSLLPSLISGGAKVASAFI